MNIVLLSGGAGKRLWPLSNNSRSKQFLKLLKDKNGQYESMVQRVYRQISETGMDAHIVVATSASQVSSIQSQLGEQVDIMIEPERRDTFPAIALAAVYLALEKKMKQDEVVIVLPVDPCADIGYFQTLLSMDEAVRAGAADIVLMGIHPTYPSEKYGYIVPSGNSIALNQVSVYPVERFQEKPSFEKAQKLLEEGAQWNGGVFAFKLGYLLDMIRGYLPITEYEEFRSHYRELKKTSFDYEVVERADSIAMVLYKGKWKDLGTWSTLSEEIEDASIGDILIGEGTSGTMVINETNMPIVVLGAKDMIVAASPDGILISDKHASSHLKPYVERICERSMYESLDQGDYWIADSVSYGDKTRSLTKHLLIRQGDCISYQLHRKRDEVWVIVDGNGEAIVDAHSRSVGTGAVVYLTAGQKHALRALSDVHMIEVQIGKTLEEEDCEVFEWLW